jgi:hypothetical protein
MPGITDITDYSALGTEFNPRFLSRLSNNQLALDNGTIVATLAGNAQGAFLIPFRPNASPETWVYAAVPEDYQKLSTPDAFDTVTNYKVGIEEPQQPVEIAPRQISFVRIPVADLLWVGTGTAGSLGTSHSTDDTIGELIQDPVDTGNTSRWSIQVSDNELYQVGQTFTFDFPTGGLALIQDVLPPINQGVPLEIDAIYYFSGSTGRCVIVPRQTAVSSSLPQVVGNLPVSDSVFTVQSIANLRRGALVELSDYTGSPTEVVLVLSVTKGPSGLIAFETETVGTFQVGDMVAGVPTIVAEHFNLNSGSTGDALYTEQLDFTLTGPGTGFVSHPLTTSPFTEVFDSARGQVAQMDDYIAFIIAISDLSKLTVGRIIWNVDPTVDYVTNFFYADFTSEDILRNNPNLTVGAKSRIPSFDEFLLTNGVTAQETTETGLAQTPDAERRNELQTQYNQLYGNPSQASFAGTTTFYPTLDRAVIQFPIRALVRGGNNQNLTLANCNGVRISLETTDTVTCHLQEIWIGGGGQPDVGRVGSPYFYCVRGRSSLTGAKSNPSPISRYGVNPRRQQVAIDITDYVGDPQQDMWDIFRFGGTVQVWRYIGSTPNLGTGSTTHYTDDNFDTSILSSPGLDFDNFEPWPSIDIPFSLIGTATINGTVLLLAFTSSGDVPATILNWAPGTLILVGDTAYTLWNRPTLVSGLTYLIRTVENMGFGSPLTVRINEPIVANQHLPYVWGPDANGTIFAVGDPLRPGTLYYAKSNDPDSAPDKFNQELTTPSEPLLGGRVLNGLSYASSSKRWFALYPSFDSITQRYQKVERAIERPLAAPYGLDDDGSNIYFWATDGIWMHNGSTGRSLTSGALKNLFPHEGVNGENVEYAGETIYAPDYRYVAQFRLSYAKGYLYADYKDSDGNPRTLVLDTTRDKPAWVIDEYADPIIVHYLIEGPENNLTTVPTATYDRLVMGDANGNLWVQQDFVDDDGVSIPAAIATFEYNGGDIRADQFFGDAFLDSIPANGLTVFPVVNRLIAGPATSIIASSGRVQSVVKASGIQGKSLGILVTWDEDYSYGYSGSDIVTKLMGWQPLSQPIPIQVFTWATQVTSFGMDGYMHIREILACYKSTADVTLTIDAYDGNDPAVVTLPSTGGVVAKIIIPVTFNKGLLYSFSGASIEPWAPYFDSWEVHVGQWGRVDQYRNIHDIEAPMGIGRSIQ